jgi:hypothetical protein
MLAQAQVSGAMDMEGLLDNVLASVDQRRSVRRKREDESDDMKENCPETADMSTVVDMLTAIRSELRSELRILPTLATKEDCRELTVRVMDCETSLDQQQATITTLDGTVNLHQRQIQALETRLKQLEDAQATTSKTVTDIEQQLKNLVPPDLDEIIEHAAVKAAERVLSGTSDRGGLVASTVESPTSHSLAPERLGFTLEELKYNKDDDERARSVVRLIVPDRIEKAQATAAATAILHSVGQKLTATDVEWSPKGPEKCTLRLKMESQEAAAGLLTPLATRGTNGAWTNHAAYQGKTVVALRGKAKYALARDAYLWEAATVLQGNVGWRDRTVSVNGKVVAQQARRSGVVFCVA